VKVHYGEGVATHTGPESCALRREASREALTGVCVGQVVSGESTTSGKLLPVARDEQVGR
jgi:hypothetical protein